MYVDWNGQWLRLVLRAYFIIATLLIGLTGDQCRKAWNKLTLAKRRPVPIHYTTGWITGFTLFLSFLDLRRIPAGAVMGILMLLMTLLAPAADLAVSGLVVNVIVQSRCDFGQGMLVNANGPGSGIDGPPWNGLPARVAANAQTTSLQNGGLQGIYIKVNSDPTFSAQGEDLIAGWTCSVFGQDLQFNSGSSEPDMVSSLIEQGYQYNSPASVSQGQAFNNEHLVVWSASATLAPFNVLASVDLNGQSTDDFEIRTWGCSIQGDAAGGLLSAMETNWTLNDWVQVFQGGCYDGSGTPARTDVDTWLEQLLNTMLMVLGGDNYLLSSPDSSSNTQGCVVTKTDVPIPIFVLVGVFAFILIAITACWLVALARIASAKRSNRLELNSALDMLPNGLTTWMLAATRESAMPSRNDFVATKASALKEWNLDLVQSMVRVSGPGQNSEEEGLVQQVVRLKGV
jgi:hypothetical protein